MGLDPRTLERIRLVKHVARQWGCEVRPAGFGAYIVEDDRTGHTVYILSKQQLTKGDGMPSNKVAKEILEEVSTMWDEYGALNNSKDWSASSDPDHIHAVLTKLKVAVMGRGCEVVLPIQIVAKRGRSYDTGIVTRFNPKSWRNAIYNIAWQWANERWDGPKRGQAWEFYFASFYRKVVRTFLGRGMYLPPVVKPPKTGPSKAEIQAGKIRRLEERRSEWVRKLTRAEAALRTIDKQLRGYELAKRRHHERTQDEEAAEGGTDRIERSGTGGGADELGLQSREAVHRHQPPAVH